ncbi:DUF3887 domain-containing protein [Synechococcus sp. CS-1331]|uniref:DUF3887 domain-containing protein n=1 Tax=Synechococcus sp. CS-1331 TaxID=2847973 RepID=UPI00223BBB7F|nr:DUF3887 domain-containing protein [Synechococcus sp. CS-1331]MCT0226855.1 DUF3887 domain-containing protein [Synechococcus sp. CS-1331]
MQMRYLRSPRRPASLALLALATAICMGAGPGLPATGLAAQEQAADGNLPGLSVEDARAAANRILKAVQSRDANLRFSQFSPELKAASSPSMVAATMRTQPQLLSWKLLSVQRGLRSTTVEVSLNTSAGKQEVFLVLNGAGQISGYHIDLADQAPSLVARKFVTALSTGHFISARGFLSLELQREIDVASLQARWQQLQRQTGDFVRINKAVEAGSSADQHLVLVYTEFNRLSDSLFVLLDNNNQIIGVDFPSDPVSPKPVP